MKDYSAKENYKTSKNLETRKNFLLDHSKPKIVLNEEISLLLNLKGSEDILDVGCGFGDTLSYFKNKNHKGRLVGVDLSEGMIEEAKRRTENLNIEFMNADAEKLLFKDKTFDIVIFKHSLYHFNSIENALKGAHRVLKDDGYLVITLNSLGDDSRRNMEHLKQVICKAINNKNFVDINHRVNAENYKNFMNGFSVLKELKLINYIKLKDKKPVIDYVLSYKESWSPIPDDAAWEKAKDEISKSLDNIMKGGLFEEKIAYLVILAQKN